MAEASAPLGYVIAVGNEKGGSGKSTTAMHLIVALLRIGKRVGSIDLDNRQWTLTRYLANRNNTMKREGVELPMPLHYYVPKSTADTRAEMEADEDRRFTQILEGFKQQCDFIVIDCPGTDSHLGRVGHAAADTIVTPLNDSYVDFDMLAITDETGVNVKKPGAYAEMVFEARKNRMMTDRRSIDWVVLRNRLSQLHSRNKEHMADAVGQVAKRIGFRIVPGFAERVIYRELFPRGLTMMDLFDPRLKREGRTTMSHIAARQEVRTLLQALQLPEVSDLSALGK
ncbi:MAG: division plane positioning ATPase MipZ [Alphaproteobacteria bacterium]|nr:division plane positioning ATPase MipZ [Alphaproteobacteria bacterium]